MKWLIAIAVVVVLFPRAVRAQPDTPIVTTVPPGEREFLGCNKYPEHKRFKWGVRGEVGVPELVASLATISCPTILVGTGIATRGGKVTLEVPDLLTAPEVYRLFYSALDVLGLTVESSGKSLKVVDGARGKENARPLRDADTDTPLGDVWVTRLVRLAHARPAEVAEVLAKLRSKDGDVTIYAPSQALLLTDRATHVRRMEELVRLLDTKRLAATDRTYILATHGSFPSDLTASFEKIFAAGRPRAEGDKAAAASTSPLADGIVALVPIDAARLIVMVGNDLGFSRLQSLAARLDPAIVDEVGNQARVIELAHTNAEEVAAALQSIGLSQRAGTPAPKPGGGAPASAATTTPSELRVGIDKTTNAILVYGSAPDFAMVRELVAKLDIPRRQVFIEATILDISVDKGRNLGLSFHMGKGNAEVGGIVAGNQGGLNTLAIDAASLATAASGGGLLAGLIGKSITAAGFTLPSFGVILQALEHSKDVSVISKPHVLTMDNTKGSLSVGQSIPYAAQSMGAAVGGLPSLLTTYQRIDVALKIDITPHLNDSDSVRLEIESEISDVPDGQTSGSQGGPTTNKRTIKTSVVVTDGETVVLGGLQKESNSLTSDKIPVLGDIPVLGKLFSTTGKSKSKHDLLIVLTPYVIRGPQDLRRIFERKQAERREFVERFSAFADESAFEPHVDYRRKRGLLEEINRTAAGYELEAAALHDAKRTLSRRVVEGLVDAAP